MIIELGQSTGIEDWMVGLLATEPHFDGKAQLFAEAVAKGEDHT